MIIWYDTNTIDSIYTVTSDKLSHTTVTLFIYICISWDYKVNQDIVQKFEMSVMNYKMIR